MCARWICLARTMFMNPDRAQKIIAACCLLHNYLMMEDKQLYCPPGFCDVLKDDGGIIEGFWRKSLPTDSMFYGTQEHRDNRRGGMIATQVRDHLKNYFNSPAGAVPWQDKYM